MKNLFKKWFESWFHCNELKEITDLLNDAWQSADSAEKGKVNFVERATRWSAQHEENEDKAWKRYILCTNTVYVGNNNKEHDPDSTNKKIDIIIKRLSERKKDIIEKRRTIVTWSSIILSLILGITGIFLSRCSTTKYDETQFNEIKQSIEQLRPSKPTDVRIINDTLTTKK